MTQTPNGSPEPVEPGSTPPSPPPPGGAGEPAAPGGGPVGPDTPDAKTMAMLCHLLVIFTGFIGPLIIWLIKKDESRFVDQQGKEALNWALTLLIAVVACVVLAFVPFINFVLCLVWPAIGACNIIFGILSTIEANKGKPYRYPVAIRFIS